MQLLEDVFPGSFRDEYKAAVSHNEGALLSLKESYMLDIAPEFPEFTIFLYLIETGCLFQVTNHPLVVCIMLA